VEAGTVLDASMASTESKREASGSSEQGTTPPALERAEAAFTRGDHAAVRKALAELGAVPAEATRTRGETLARAVSVDPALVAVLITCLLGWVAMCFHYVLE
jgi:hypothetical protein